jgi:hypothetical protein
MFTKAKVWVGTIIAVLALFAILWVWAQFAGSYHAVGVQIRGGVQALIDIFNGIFGTHVHLP